MAELEFREKVRGVACRRGWLAVALRRRVVAFEVGEVVTRYGEWDTCDNPRGQSTISLFLNRAEWLLSRWRNGHTDTAIVVFSVDDFTFYGMLAL